MSDLTLHGVPESVPIEQLRELIRVLGLDVEHLREMHITRHAITAWVYATDENGRRYVVGHDNKVAVHEVVIRVVDPDDTHFTAQYETFDPEPVEEKP